MENSMDNQIRKMLNTLIEDSALFLVDLKIKPGNNIKIYLDGDSGVTIDAVSKINKVLYKQVEESGLFPDGNFSMEVSSTGVDEPLKFLRQYKKNIGRKVEVTLNEGGTKEGILKEATEAAIAIEETIGKKKETKNTIIAFGEIKKTVVQIIF